MKIEGILPFAHFNYFSGAMACNDITMCQDNHCKKDFKNPLYSVTFWTGHSSY